MPAVLCALCTVLFALLLWQVTTHGPAYRWDVTVDARVLAAAAAHPRLLPVARLLADLGDPAVALPPLAAVLVHAARRRRSQPPPAAVGRRPAAALPVTPPTAAPADRGMPWWLPSAVQAAAMACAGPLVLVFKALITRPAPNGQPKDPADYLPGGYFPSGHTMTAAMAYGLAVLALAPLLHRSTARRLLIAAAVPLNLAVGAGLVWCGYHWPLDVLASWCLAGLLLTAARSAARARPPTTAGITRWSGTPD